MALFKHDFRPRDEEQRRAAKKHFVKLIQYLAMAGIVSTLIFAIFLRDEIHLDLDGNCIRKIEITLFDEIEHPCTWREGRSFDKVWLDLPLLPPEREQVRKNTRPGVQPS